MIDTVHSTPALHIDQITFRDGVIGDLGMVVTHDTAPDQVPKELAINSKEKTLSGVFNDNSVHVLKFLKEKEYEAIIHAYAKARNSGSTLSMTFYDKATLQSTRDSFGQIDSDNVVAYTAAVHKIATPVPVTLR